MKEPALCRPRFHIYSERTEGGWEVEGERKVRGTDGEITGEHNECGEG